MHPNSANANEKELPVSRTGKKLWIVLSLICFLLFMLTAYILKYFTDSPIPYWDSFTTSLSIVATWMLARKKIEHWLLWTLIDSVSIVLYIFRGLYPTTILFIAYNIIAVVGYMEWQKELKRREWQKTQLSEL